MTAPLQPTAFGSARAAFPAAQAAARRAVMQKAVPSCVVALAQGGDVHLVEAAGHADLDQQRRPTLDTPYSLASITKPITAVALMRLSRRGCVDLDRPIDDYLGGVGVRARCGRAADATVRRVANHTAGLPVHYRFYYADEAARPPDRAETIVRYGNLVTAPGERFHYSNLGYGMLDHLLAQLTGVSYADVVQREVFDPLGMTASAVGCTDLVRGQAAPRYGQDRVAYPDYDFDHPGGSAAYASARDLLAFASVFLPSGPGRNLLDDEARSQLLETPGIRADGSAYGLGIGISRTPAGQQMLGHSGGMGGVSTLLRVIPEADLAFVVLCNGAGEVPATVAAALLAELFPSSASQVGQVAPVRLAPHRGLRRGRWTGAVALPEGDIEIGLESNGAGRLAVSMGGAAAIEATCLPHPDPVSADHVACPTAWQLPTADAEARQHEVVLDLTEREGRLTGAAVAVNTAGWDDAAPPERRCGNALAYWLSATAD